MSDVNLDPAPTCDVCGKEIIGTSYSLQISGNLYDQGEVMETQIELRSIKGPQYYVIGVCCDNFIKALWRNNQTMVEAKRVLNKIGPLQENG